MSRAGPLAGVRVVGIEHSVAAPLCTRILAELGAEVIKVERAGRGDFARSWDNNARGESAQFWWLNRGKRSVTLNLRDADDRRQLDELLETADVAVFNMSPPAADRLGLTGDVAARFPRLVLCQISGYGNTESSFRERKAYDMLIQAETGIMSLTGTPETPTRVGVSICDVSTGLYATILVLAALKRRDETGKGAYLDVGMMDVSLEFLGPMLVSYLNAGVTYERLAASHHAVAPYGVFSTREGDRVLLAVENEGEWRDFCRLVLRDEQLADRPEFATNSARVEHLDELTETVQERLSSLALVEVIALLEEARVGYSRLNDVRGVVDHPVIAARSLINELANANGDPVRSLVGIAERAFETESAQRRPPLLGEDNPSYKRTDADVIQAAGE